MKSISAKSSLRAIVIIPFLYLIGATQAFGFGAASDSDNPIDVGS